MNDAREFDYKIADYSFDVVKFVMTLYVRVTAFLFAVFAAFIVFSASPGITVGLVAKSVMIGLATSLILFTSVCYYLVLRSAREFVGRLRALSPQAQTRFDRAHWKFVLLGSTMAVGAVLVCLCLITVFYNL